jgi:undecaprenyl-diphosphatase
MSIWTAALLGLVQGVAEFLPISSSGHLSIINNLFNLSEVQNGHLFFDVLLHLATLISILVVYWNDILQMIYEVLGFVNLGPYAGERQDRYPSARMFIMIVIATLPLFLVLPIRKQLESLYYQNVFIGVAIILTGCMLYVADKMLPGKKTERTMTLSDALIIGLCQCVATIPGLSRSGTTITAGIATGLRREYAVKFSFLMSIPAVLGANILSFADAIKAGIDWAYVPAYLVGMVLALLSGIASIHFIRYISAKAKFGGFAYYCWVVGVLAIVMSLIF